MGAMGPKTPHTSSQMADEKLSKAPQEAPVVVEKKLVNKERILGTIDMVEEWQLLPFVKTGYRLNYSYKDAFRSIFSWHNDTLNIWTHIMGIAYYLFMIPHVFSELGRQGAGEWDRYLFKIYIVCALIQMGASALYHTVRCVSKWAEDNFLRIDLAGIVTMIIGSYIVAMGQGFTCIRSAFSLYIGILLVILGTGCMLSFHSAFQEPRFEAIRHTIMGTGVAFGVIPSLHWLYHCGQECSYVIYTAMLSMFGLYFAGFMVYLGRFPERVSTKGKFDLVGASHQLWHVLVFLAGRAWLLGMIDYHAFRRVRAGLPLYVDHLDSHPLYGQQESKLSWPLSFVRKEFHGVEEILQKYGLLQKADPINNPEPYTQGLHAAESLNNSQQEVDLTIPPVVAMGKNVRSSEEYSTFLQAAQEALQAEDADAFYRVDPYEFSILSHSAIKAAVHLTDGFDHLYTDELLACEKVLRMDETFKGQFHFLSKKDTSPEELLGAWELFRDNIASENVTALFKDADDHADDLSSSTGDESHSSIDKEPSVNQCKALMLDLASGIMPFLSKENEVISTKDSATSANSAAASSDAHKLGHSLLLLNSDLQLTCDPNGSGKEIANFVLRMLGEANHRFFSTHDSIRKFVKFMVQKKDAFHAALEPTSKMEQVDTSTSHGNSQEEL